MNAKEYIDKGKAELLKKTLNDIQKETAKVWMGRACAAALMGLHGDAKEYAHEAIEHAALSGDDMLLINVRSVLLDHEVEL